MKTKKLFSTEIIDIDSDIILERIRVSMAENLLPMYSDESIYILRPGMPRKDVASVEKMLSRMCAEIEEKTAAYFVIKSKADGTYLGVMECFHFDSMTDKIEIGYTIFPNQQGKGLATKAIGLLSRFLLTEIDANRITASVHPDNAASNKALLKCSFTYEGTAREGELWPGIGLVDVKQYSLLKKDLF
ncbi:MAG: GNAT family N-acetyltransferase [Lachnospiraceae bacterium]|nr:GNAT family N-acetyltransferase [Lachnospiraceae bacterium]